LTEYLQKASSERDILASNNPYSSPTSNLNPATFIRNKMEDMRGVDHETARQERLRKLELKIQELNREVESAKQTSEMFDEQVVREVGDFERIKGVEFRAAWAPWQVKTWISSEVSSIPGKDSWWTWKQRVRPRRIREGQCMRCV